MVVAYLELDADARVLLAEHELRAFPVEVARRRRYREAERLAVPLADSVAVAVDPAGGGEEPLRPREVEGPESLDGRMVVGRTRMIVAVRGDPYPVVNLFGELPAIGRERERAAHPRVAQNRMLAVEIEMLVEERRISIETHPAEALHDSEERVRRVIDPLNLARLELHDERVPVGNELDHDLLEIGTRSVVVAVRHEDDVRSGHPRLEDEGTRSDGAAVERGRLKAASELAREEMPRQHRLVVETIPGEVRVYLAEVKNDGVRVRRFHPTDDVPALARFDVDVRMHHDLPAELRVVGGDGNAVVPASVLPDAIGIGEMIGRDAAVLHRRNLLDEIGNEIEPVVVLHELAEDEVADVDGRDHGVYGFVQDLGLLLHADDEAAALSGRPAGVGPPSGARALAPAGTASRDAENGRSECEESCDSITGSHV